MNLTFANKVTIGRILLVPFFIATVMYVSTERPLLHLLALSLFVIAVISDVIDGYIARTRGQKTRAGAILDPLADKMLLISAFICLYIKRDYFTSPDFPLWFVVAIISRDVILLLGAMIVRITTGNLDIEANKTGKLTAFLHVACVLGVLLQMPASKLLWPFAIGATIISGVIYIKEGIKKINDTSVHRF